MEKHPVTKYIEESKNSGWTSAQIVQALADAGWRTHEILEILLDHHFPLKSKEAGPEEAASDAIISVKGVSKTYGKVKALDNVSLQVRRGSVTALLGPNGAGKTTLVKILTTLLLPTSGSAEVSGFDVVRDAHALRGAIGLAGQSAAVDPILTGRENLEMVGRLYHLTKKQSQARASELLKQFDLEDAADRIAKTYSGGMRRRLDLAASLIIKPKMLFLDEPTSGLDPRSRFAMWNVIRELVADGTTLLLTTQYLEEADQLADYIFVIDRGQIIARGTVDELKRQTGGDVLELRLAKHEEAMRAAEIVAPYGDATPQADPGSGVVTMSTDKGAAILVEVVRQFDAEGLKLSDVLLRRPSLDDVFMKLTGHTAEENN